MTKSPKKILIQGVSASGKTTFGEKLAHKLQRPVIMVDEIMWKPNWVYVGDEETAKKLKKVTSKEAWIIEGYIVGLVRQDVFDQADLILYLDYSGWFSAYRYMLRFIKHRNDPRPEILGCPEKFSLEFLWRVFKKKEVYKVEKLIRENNYESKVVRFKKPSEAKKYLDNLV
tara:strand:+ start:740 stop:1252 length:513 start_codon:yes stop_codon:yes gene_type:complete